MNTQQLIDAIKAATKTKNVAGIIGMDKITYIDADAFLAAVERLAEAEKPVAPKSVLTKENMAEWAMSQITG